MPKTVFLSSTGADLSAHRAQIVEDARGHDWFRLDAMEDWGARSRPPIHLCRERVADSGIFVGLIGHYRGWEPDGDNAQRSITEMEYDWAADAKKPRLMFVAPEAFAGAAPASDGDAGARQRRFRARLMSAETVDQRCFGSAHALSAAVVKAIYNELLYDIAGKAKAGAPGPAGQLDAAAMAGAVVADVGREENLSLEEMQARGFGLDEIEALLTKQKRDATARMTRHREAEAEARKEAALAARRLGSLAFPYDTAKALAHYAEAAALDPEDWEALWYLGQIQQRAGDLPGAKASYERLAALHPALENPRFIHWTYFLLGDVEAALGNRIAALGHYQRGQALVQDLAGRDPDSATWQRDLSVSTNKIGDISAARGDRDGALKAYSDGLEIAKRLAARDPNNAEWQRDLSVSYDRVGDISAARGDRDGALKAYSDGLEIAKRLAARDPNNVVWQRDLSVSYDRVGDISAARGDRDGALKAYSDGLEIRKRLAARDPNNAEWQRDLSVSHNKIGDISAARGDRDGALKAYSDGLEIRKRLAARDPNNVVWQTDLVVSAWKLAQAGAKDGRQHLADGLAILKRLDADGRLTADQKGWIAAFEERIAE